MSNYPDGLDSLSTGFKDFPDTSTLVTADHLNKNSDAVNSIEAELGVTPSGEYDTVAARLDSGARAFLTPTKPTGLAWDETNFGFSVLRVDDIVGTQRSVVTLSKTAEDFFDAVSTARTAPAQTFYVSSTGSDSTGTGTLVNPWKSIWKAVQNANSAGTPTRVVAAAGTYFRGNQPWASGIVPTVDIAFVASGGRVVTGSFDNFSAPSRDATQTNTYSFSVANCQAVYDTLNRDKFGNYTELINVSSAALCNATPNSWNLTTGTLYINRADQRAVTVSNTRVFRPQTGCLIVTTPVNIYVGGAEAGSGFDMEGNSDTGGGVLGALVSTPGSTRHVLAAKDSTFRYGGGFTDTTNNGVNVNSWKGLAVFVNCRADANRNDGFNFHNSNAASGMYVLTVNCTGYDNGRNPNQSDNGWTTHEDVIGIDVCGYYEGNHGGSVRSIGISKSWLLRTTAKDDLGDLCFGGSTLPTAFRVDDTATYWCERTRVFMPAGCRSYHASFSGSTIHKRNTELSGMPDVSASGATIDTF